MPFSFAMQLTAKYNEEIGKVASTKAAAWMTISLLRPSSNGHAENVSDEHGLTGYVVFRYPPHLSLAYHVHRFDSLKRSPRGVKRSESLTRSKSPHYGSMILLDDVVQVPYGSTTAAATEVSGVFQFGYGLRIRRIPVDVDHPRTRMPGERNALCRNRLAATASRFALDS